MTDFFLQQMLNTIQIEARDAVAIGYRDAGVSPQAMAAVSSVQRHAFVPENMVDEAYENRPLPIGYGQTISQPYIVALMTTLLALQADDVVLEVGTGCGYQAAVLAQLAAKVYSLEVVPALARQTQIRLASLGYNNIEVLCANGAAGLAEHAPYDAIIVTAAPEKVPEALVTQLKAGGRLVIPVGGRIAGQALTLIEKDQAGGLHSKAVLPVSFVPFVM